MLGNRLRLRLRKKHRVAVLIFAVPILAAGTAYMAANVVPVTYAGVTGPIAITPSPLPNHAKTTESQTAAEGTTASETSSTDTTPSSTHTTPPAAPTSPSPSPSPEGNTTSPGAAGSTAEEPTPSAGDTAGEGGAGP